MEGYLRKLSAYVAEHPPDFHSDGGDTILDALFWVYCENASADCKVVQQGYDVLNHLLKNMPADHVSTIINTVSDLCWEHDRLGFINGVKTGMRLEQELSQ